jgi:DNA replication protein DnaC
MYKSLADHSSRALLDRLMRVDLLLIDEMGYLNLRPEQSNIFFKAMEERYGKKATIITTNLEYEDWYDLLGQKEMVGALLDRLITAATPSAWRVSRCESHRPELRLERREPPPR